MELTTKRFVLRDFSDADSAAFESYHNDPRSQEFYGAEQTKPEHARELISLFKAWAAAQPRLNYQPAIIQRSGPQALVGCCGVRCAGSEPGTAELGIELAPEYWGRYAYAIEVMRALLEFGFGTLELHTIYGGTVSANSRVARLVSAFGATAVTRPTPDWMSSKGWTQVEWQITRQQWESGRLTRRSSRRAQARGWAWALARTSQSRAATRKSGRKERSRAGYLGHRRGTMGVGLHMVHQLAMDDQPGRQSRSMGKSRIDPGGRHENE